MEVPMSALTTVSHAHHDVLMGHANRLNDLAGCLNADCLDTAGLIALMPQLRDVHHALLTRLIPHMETVEAAVYPTLERLMVDRQISAPMAAEHNEIRRLVTALGDLTSEASTARADRSAVLTLRRVLLRLYVLLKTHLAEEELYLPILEDRLTPTHEAALARALDHLAAERV
jgi:iron-sulfur cluster repair protein YtfE (RIC family)